jgi:hypothetical protein
MKALDSQLWIHDLAAMDRIVYRILKPPGTYIMYDIHPLGRLFAYFGDDLKMIKPHDDTKLEEIYSKLSL